MFLLIIFISSFTTSVCCIFSKCVSPFFALKYIFFLDLIQNLIDNGADINTITDNGYYVKKLGAKLNKDSNKIVGIRFI